MIYQKSGWKTNGETVYNKSIKAYPSLSYIAASCSSLWEPIKPIQRCINVITE